MSMSSDLKEKLEVTTKSTFFKEVFYILYTLKIIFKLFFVIKRISLDLLENLGQLANKFIFIFSLFFFIFFLTFL